MERRGCTVETARFIFAGNRKVLKKYNCTYLRQAAINVTMHTTGSPPHPKQPVYGARALDAVFGFGGISGGAGGEFEFDIAKFFGVEPPIRINTLASPDMVKLSLIRRFGEHEEFTDEISKSMKAVMIEDLQNNIKEEYMSDMGLAMLFDRAGGRLTEHMTNVIAKVDTKSQLHQQLIQEV